jgi:pimeloyl-ACP methyl ester carboxylesterase
MSTTVAAGSLRPIHTTTTRVDGVEVTVTERNRTRPFLLLHGGAGPASMASFADLLAERTHSHVLLPTHPGFAGTARPASLATTADLARFYVQMLENLGLAEVTVIGNSFGGWLATEIALQGSPRVSGVVLLDAIGLQIEGHPPADVSGLSPAEIVARSFHDPARAPKPPANRPAGPNPDIAALIAYAGGPAMSDPTLLKRLPSIDIPVHVVWGESDGIVNVAHGRAFADAIPVAHLTVLARSGHLPQLETPEELLGALLDLGND